ncbi:flagellar motor switch protein FliM [Halocella sp. SP3-1]|uniref:flagellar motor switch protein FliM n=1 Tax=Halocella sp. SP3-1 TaxID=2382161 RepID=UPI000F7561C7|nr:flagellar motor switch protein FliM [Halocella sp. SP3-1]AZO94050.1 flagellar motor switch protein FliM [Halocella sp. SP3-1]MTI58793.1 flagellar motor switch protein FliM [Bacillota bacterium]
MADVLSQNEIDSLLTALSSGDVDVEEIKKETENQAVKAYDFRRPDKLSKEQMRTLQMIHENLARSLTTILSTQLRTMVDFDVASIEQITYEEFIRSLPEPTIIGISDLEPFKGQFIFELNPDIGFAVIDRLFGGFGKSNFNSRPFTDIEKVVFKRVINWILSGFPEAWENIVRVNPVLRDIESNPQFTQIVPSNDMTILITLMARIGDSEGLINICIPYIMIEPIVPKLNAQQWFSNTRSEQTAQHINTLKNKIKRTSLDVYAELGGAELTVSELLYLQKGDVIKLDKRSSDNIDIRIGKYVKFKGIPGKANKHLAMKVVEVVDTGEEGEEDDEQ